MLKKLWISLALTLVAAMVISSVALAAAQPFSRPGSRMGQVNEVSKDKFTLLTGGVEKTVLVSPSTRFVKVNGDAKTFKNLASGQSVIAFGSINEHHDLVAAAVLIAPRRFNQGDWGHPRQFGTVLAVDSKAGTFRVNTPAGFLTFKTDEDTRFSGQVKTLGSLKDGMTVFVSYQRASRGDLVVKALVAVP